MFKSPKMGLLPNPVSSKDSITGWWVLLPVKNGKVIEDHHGISMNSWVVVEPSPSKLRVPHPFLYVWTWRTSWKCSLWPGHVAGHGRNFESRCFLLDIWRLMNRYGEMVQNDVEMDQNNPKKQLACHMLKGRTSIYPQSLGSQGTKVLTTNLKVIDGWWLTYPSEKYEFVSWDDDIPNWMENLKKCSKPPTR